jgi:transposase
MCSMTTVLVPEDQTEPTLEDLERQICELAADLAAATCRWLDLVAEFDARGGWREWGVNSCAHWLSWRCGIGLLAAREHTRIARALRALPRVHEHFITGELSYTKVRAITRVAQPENEAELVEIARHATGAQMDRLVQGYSGVIRATREHAQTVAEKQSLSCLWGDDGMLHIQGRLAPEDGAALLAALQSAAPDEPTLSLGNRQAQALGTLARGEATASAEIIVHVDAATLDSEHIVERCEIEHGPTLAPETARRLGCDAALVTIVERDGQPLAVGRRTRTINPALKRSLNSRDHGCRFPGCTNTRWLHAHHIEHWVKGGKTEIGNLVQLCTHHHHLVHEGGYTIRPDATGQLEFLHPRGWVIPPLGPALWAGEESIRSQNQTHGVFADDRTCFPLSAGDRLDYDIAVEGLARKWLPPPGMAAAPG